MDFNFMMAQLEDEVELPVDETTYDNEVVVPEEDPAVQAAETAAEEEQIELYCQSIRALMDEVYCVNSTISRYGETGARLAARLFPNAPVEMLVAGQEGFKEVLKKIWNFIRGLWNKLIFFLARVYMRIFRRDAAEEWEKAYKEAYKAFNEASKHSSSAGMPSAVIEVYDPKAVQTYAKRVQVRLRFRFNVETALYQAEALLKLLKSDNKPNDSILKDIAETRTAVNQIHEDTTNTKSLNAEALHQLNKIRFTINVNTLQQLSNDLKPLITVQESIRGWKSYCNKITAVAKEITLEANKRSQATGTDEEVKVAREISKVSTEIVSMLTATVGSVGMVSSNADSILDSYLKQIRAVAEPLAKKYNQRF